MPKPKLSTCRVSVTSNVSSGREVSGPSRDRSKTGLEITLRDLPRWLNGKQVRLLHKPGKKKMFVIPGDVSVPWGNASVVTVKEGRTKTNIKDARGLSKTPVKSPIQCPASVVRLLDNNEVRVVVVDLSPVYQNRDTMIADALARLINA